MLMLDRATVLRLDFETADELRVVGQLGSYDLDGDLASNQSFCRTVDRPERTLGDQFAQFIATELAVRSRLGFRAAGGGFLLERQRVETTRSRAGFISKPFAKKAADRAGSPLRVARRVGVPGQRASRRLAQWVLRNQRLGGSHSTGHVAGIQPGLGQLARRDTNFVEPNCIRTRGWGVGQVAEDRGIAKDERMVDVFVATEEIAPGSVDFEPIRSRSGTPRA